MIKLNLGIVYKDNKIVNHRSLLKVTLNPSLRIIGFCIATDYNPDRLGKPVFIKQKRQNPSVQLFKNSWVYDIGCDRLVRKRMII